MAIEDNKYNDKDTLCDEQCGKLPAKKTTEGKIDEYEIIEFKEALRERNERWRHSSIIGVKVTVLYLDIVIR